MALFAKKFEKFMRKNQSNSNSLNFKNKIDAKCFNCDKPGHYAASCWRPKRDQQKPNDEKDSKAIKQKEQKALIAAEGKSKWAESDSDDDDDEVIKCFMANDSEEVFDFTSEEFSKNDLIDALNDMVVEYKKFSENFSKL